MHAQVLREQKSADENPLTFEEVESPTPRANEIRIRISACGVCHTDLHIVEGELHPPLLPLIPGHQIVGVVDALGQTASRFKTGARVGVPWLNWIDPKCEWYGSDRENLCEQIRFTGFDTNGGFAEFVTVDEEFAYALPEAFSDIQAAPLMCAGVIGYRALRLSEIDMGQRLGLFGFGASAHIVLQIARHWGKSVYVFTRSPAHQELARAMGAEWVGASEDSPPHSIDSGIIFAPVGDLVVRGLELLGRGGTLVHAGVYSTPIPQFDYRLLYEERKVRSAANSTRRDVEELLEIAAEIPVQTQVQNYELADANRALQDLKHSRINGAAVLNIG